MNTSVMPQGLSPEDSEEARIRRAFERADAELSAERGAIDKAHLDKVNADSFLPDWMDNIQTAIGGGGLKALFETKDFVFGDTPEGQKSAIRRRVEAEVRGVGQENTAYGLTAGVTQIAVGLIGAGKVMAPVKVLQKGGRFAYEALKASVASSIVLDPHEERLSDLIETFPDLQNPVTEYLASDFNDSAAEGRFKNAIESLGLDYTFLGALKVLKLLRAGNMDEAAKAITALEKSQQANREAFSMDFSEKLPAAPDLDAKPLQANVDAFGTDFGPGAKIAPPVAPGAPVAAAAPAESSIEQVGKQTVIDPATGRPAEGITPEMAGGGSQVVKSQDIGADEIKAIVAGAEADTKAIIKHGSREAAESSGFQFSTKQKLPWQKLRTTTHSQALLENTTTVLKARYNQAKGGAVLKDARVQQVVDDAARTYNEDPAMILGQLAEAGEDAAQMVAHMESSLLIGNRMFNDASQLALRIRNGQLDEFGGNSVLATEEFKGQLAIALDTLAAGNSILANSGRSLRRARGDFRFSKKDLASIQAMDPEKMLVILEKADGDPRKAAAMLRKTWVQRVQNEATWHLTNGLLWLWPTHLVNTTTNAYMMVARPTEKLFGSAAIMPFVKDAARRAELSSIARQALKEYTYTIAALGDGWQGAVEAFKRGDSILSPHNTEFFDETLTGVQTAPLPWKPINSVVDLAQNAWMAANYRTMVGLPTRALGSADEFFKTLRYRAVIQARAAVAASDRGLTGQDYKDHIQKAMDDAIDVDSGQALDASVIREAQTVSFQNDLNYDTWNGSMGRGIQGFRRTFPPLAVVLPFVKTPVNVVRYGLKMTPGLNLLQKEFNQAIRGKSGAEAQAHAIGQMTLGAMFGGLAANLAFNDSITGSGPDDFKLKQELIATGWKPYSIRWQDGDGNWKYFQMGRFDPVGMAMGMVADIVALQKKNPEADYSAIVMAVSIAVAKNLGEKTFLLNLDSFMQAATDPENRLAKWSGRTAGSMLPFSSLMRGHNPDPYLREARAFVDSAIRGVPGVSETLPRTLDVFGDPVERYVGVLDTQDGGDIVEAEHNRIMLQTDTGIGKPQPQFEGVDLRDINLESGVNAYQRYQELSGHPQGLPSLKSALAELIATDLYQDLSDGDSGVKGTRLNALGMIVSKYRTAAKKQLLQENPELKPLVKARQIDAKGAYEVNKSARQQPARDIVNSFGR